MVELTNFRPVRNADVAAIHDLEQRAFTTDKLSLRRIKHWVKAKNCVFLVVELQTQVVGYGLVLLHQGTRLARLYSIAIDPDMKGRGLGKQLLAELEASAIEQGRLYMRLEVAKENAPAINMYQAAGYFVFDELDDYYDDHQTALRMQKCIRQPTNTHGFAMMPWYQQTTEFTCGPASLMMAMSQLDSNYRLSVEDELDIWREATTIFMTSGHGGCHPVGLALAAQTRGFKTAVYINQTTPLFVDGVRNENKKAIMTTVDKQFHHKAQAAGVGLQFTDFTQQNIADFLQTGAAVLVLISTFRLDGRKAPHWVAVSGIDAECLYLHDPDPVRLMGVDTTLDCRYVPIAREDFAKMSMFGGNKLRACVVLSRN